MGNFKALGLFVALGVFLSSEGANAWCRKTTCDANVSDDCQGPLDPECKLLYWPSRCVGVSLQQDATELIDFETFEEVTTQAFGRWLAADCGYGEGPKIQVDYQRPVSCNVAEFNRKGGNANVIMFHSEAWPYEDLDGTLGLATTTFDKKTGEIYDVDIELNAAHGNLTTTGRGNDLSSVLAHEIGHFFGLAHSEEPKATMYYAYVSGKSMSTPSADDHNGLCNLFSDSNPSCDSTPRGGHQSSCGDPSPEDDGCSFSGRPPASSSNSAFWVGMGLVAVWAARRRLQQ